ncbi:MAG: cation:proton antiporter [Candidatus Kerfeldbacteria bacterium]|nr:cation:proton antiporter [Candidatus Kerfeldbacteria bacterium]
MDSIFFEISAILIVATLCATVAKFFRQPMIPAYILAGVILGPSVLNVIRSGELLDVLSTFGIAFLLFLVGIELDLRKFFNTGKVAILVGCIQMGVAVGLGYLVTRLLGFPPIPSLLLAIALGFSSTIVVLKLLGERKELDTLYGQLVIGLLLTQDFMAILVLIFFGIFSGSASGTALVSAVGIAILKIFCLFLAALLSSRFLLRYIFTYFARSSELLFLGSICWCLVFSVLALQLGFSVEVGALLAGISLSFLPYSIEIAHRITSLRDFFLPLFFAILGGELIFSTNAHILLPTIILSLFVLIVSSVVVTGALLLFGYRSHTSFQAGFAIGQVSEFSFILINLAYLSGIVEHEFVSLIALIGLITVTISTYMIEYSDQLYVVARPLLKKFQRRKHALRLEHIPEKLQHHVVLCGHHMMGHRARTLIEELQKPVMVIDTNPDVIRHLQQEQIPHIYGSMGDDEVLEKAALQHADLIISTVRTRRDTLALLKYARAHKVRAKIFVTAFHIDDALEFYHYGASFVILPTSISADYLSTIVSGNVTKRRKQHIAELKKLHKIQFAL